MKILLIINMSTYIFIVMNKRKSKKKQLLSILL